MLIQDIKITYTEGHQYGPYDGIAGPRYYGDPSITIELKAAVTQQELRHLQSNSNTALLMGGQDPFHLPIQLVNVPAVPKTVPPPEHWHSQPLHNSRAVGKFSFKAAKQQYQMSCGECAKELKRPEDGRVIQGSVFMAEAVDDKSKSLTPAAIYCVNCFKKAVNV